MTQQQIPPNPGLYHVAILRRDGVPQLHFPLTVNVPRDSGPPPLPEQWRQLKQYIHDTIHDPNATHGREHRYAQPVPYLDVFGESEHRTLPFFSHEIYAWREPWLDHPLDLDGDYCWFADVPGRRPSDLPWLRFSRVVPLEPGANADAHTIDHFAVGVADRRPDLLRRLSDLHSADVRADAGLHDVQLALCDTMGLVRGILLREKAALGEAEENRAEVGRLAAAIARLDALDSRIESHAADQFAHAAAAKLAAALVHGHGAGRIRVPPDAYLRLARRWAARLQSEPRRTAKLVYAVANLMADDGRTPTDRLVPLDADDIHPDRIYSRITRPPPQYGTERL